VKVHRQALVLLRRGASLHGERGKECEEKRETGMRAKTADKGIIGLERGDVCLVVVGGEDFRRSSEGASRVPR
jgi:hypothetical protein